MNYTERDNKELQEVFEQLIRAVQDLESSDHLTQMERDQKTSLVQRLNRRYEVLNTRAQYNRIKEMKIEYESQATKFFRGLIIGVSIGLVGYILSKIVVN